MILISESGLLETSLPKARRCCVEKADREVARNQDFRHEKDLVVAKSERRKMVEKGRRGKAGYPGIASRARICVGAHVFIKGQ